MACNNGNNIVERRLFCGGTFCFDYKCEDYRSQAQHDYRVSILGDVDSLLKYSEDGVLICKGIRYIGPFYFETDGMEAEQIIEKERQMIEACTDAIFVLDEAACPGTITEIIYASSLRKNLHLLYIKYGDDVETESPLHTPCWYPLLFCMQTNGARTHLHSCRNSQDIRLKLATVLNDINIL